jgi:arylsulfatase
MTEEFQGTIGRTFKDSEAWWPNPPTPPEGAPNVVYIVLDDTGYGQLGCYGGLIETPNMDRLADNGLRYTDFHTTAICSPTRACLLTGRNHHSAGYGFLSEFSSGYPGYNATIPKSVAMLPSVLKEHGYSTYCVGKWHLSPVSEFSQAGPFDHWPLGMGFQRFYGFLGGETNQFYPDLVYDNHIIDPPKTPEEGYHVTEDLTDKAVEFIRDTINVDPDAPFCMYLSYGANHAPHHTTQEWRDKYKGKFDMGWDRYREQVLENQKAMGIVAPNTELSPRPEFITAWDDLSDVQKQVYARFMENYAAFCGHLDDNIGRFIDFLESADLLDNTLVVVVSDNGASAEGGPDGTMSEDRFWNYIFQTPEEMLPSLDEIGEPETFPHYPIGWAHAGDSPLKRWKRESFNGGNTDPFIVHWPKGIQERGGIRHQYHHAIDVVPTILEAIGLDMPDEHHGVAQKPIEGVSMRYSFDDADAPDRKETQYYEILGTRALWHKGWKAVTEHQMETGGHFDDDQWELYHVAQDFSECHNLAEEHPEKLQELIDLWWLEAEKHNVLPLDDRFSSRLVQESRPRATLPRDTYVFYPDAASVNQFATVSLITQANYTITAHADIPEGGAEGVLLAQGGMYGGWSLFMQNNRLVYAFNYLQLEEYIVQSDVEVPAGEVTLGFAFEATGEPDVLNGKGTPGIGRLFINGEQVAETELAENVAVLYSSTEGVDCGRDPLTAVSKRYEPPYAFTGHLEKVTIDVSGEHLSSRSPDSGYSEHHEARARMDAGRAS